MGGFQVAHLRGARLSVDFPDRRQPAISIHAPHAGCDIDRSTASWVFEISIHAPAQGATLLFGRLCELRPISIHAPTQGATRGSNQSVKNTAISIHAPTQGATLITANVSNGVLDFNPRTHTGCDSNKAQKHFILFLLYYTASPMLCQFAAANPPLPLSLLPCNCPHAVRRFWGNPVHLPFAPEAIAL